MTSYYSRLYRPRRSMHKWQMTERREKGVTLKFHACTTCVPAHLKAYDMQVYNRSAFQGAAEYATRSQKS